MNLDTFVRSMAELSAAIDKPIKKATLDIWFEVLKDLPDEVVTAATRNIIATDEYPVLPSVGKIRRAAVELMHPRRLTSAEAWGSVLKAIRDYGHYRETEALASLPDEAAQVAKMMGWREMCFAENIEVIRGQYLKMFESMATRNKEMDLLAPAVQCRQLQEGE